MVGWIHFTVAAVCVGVLVALLTLFIRRCCWKKHRGIADANRTGAESLEVGIAKLQQHASLRHQLDPENKRRANYYVFRRGVSGKPPLFNWADYPSLVTDAVEHGWSQFAFTGYSSSSSSARSTLLGLCVAGDPGRDSEAELGWEICPGSADFMQKVGLKRVNTINHSTAPVSVVRTALPLPGPPLGNSAFPQEAYFEITVLSRGENDQEARNSSAEGERTKLIQENSKVNSESLVHFSGSHGEKQLEELRISNVEDSASEVVQLSLGLTGGGFLPLKLPGTYPGSIGFNSNGCVFLDGVKLVLESEKAEWGQRDKVIGCGFNPSQKKVFFTVDSEVVRVIHCKSEEFGAPLYPTLASNTDITVLVNFGQSSFKYAQANAHRTPNPCFIGPLVNSPAAAAALGYEDSKELFSMGRIDSQWLNRSTTKTSLSNSNKNNKGADYDQESDTELFEIVLDSRGQSPNTIS
ncbi:uncharacterized protein LOC131162026 [Malania oleifera]|uniref:uncharacterized protein LOC131162026 n=1 Tax=Malania oleifera TaxID=397392 RepID=UPI0025AEC76B|nr:uncharacterized protein LOC131162026 [Malania oleifera]